MKRVAWRHNSQANILNFVLCASWIENDVRTASHESESTYGATDYARDVRDLDQGHRSQITTAFNFFCRSSHWLFDLSIDYEHKAHAF